VQFLYSQKEAIPILESLKSKITQLAPLFTPKSLMGAATRYFLSEYEHLKGYTENAVLEIDNNRTERVMRPIALGRKNYLFAGSEGGAHRAAEFYSLIETAKNMDVNPWNYICHLLQCIDENGKCKPILFDEFKKITEERNAELV
jgi:transposase